MDMSICMDALPELEHEATEQVLVDLGLELDVFAPCQALELLRDAQLLLRVELDRRDHGRRLGVGVLAVEALEGLADLGEVLDAGLVHQEVEEVRRDGGVVRLAADGLQQSFFFSTGATGLERKPRAALSDSISAEGDDVPPC